MTDNSFTYMISSDDRTNNKPGSIVETLPPLGETMYYNINFGGFTEQYDDYNCEVISFSLGAAILCGESFR